MSEVFLVRLVHRAKLSRRAYLGLCLRTQGICMICVGVRRHVRAYVRAFALLHPASRRYPMMDTSCSSSRCRVLKILTFKSGSLLNKDGNFIKHFNNSKRNTTFLRNTHIHILILAFIVLVILNRKIGKTWRVSLSQIFLQVLKRFHHF